MKDNSSVMKSIDLWLENFTVCFNQLLESSINPETGKTYTLLELDVRTGELGHRVSHSHLHKLLSGRANNPSLKTVVTLANAFRVHPTYFLSEGTDIPQFRSEEGVEKDMRGFASELREAIRKVEKEHGLL